MIRVPEVKLSLNRSEKELKFELAKKLKISQDHIISYRIFKKSIDARKKNNIQFVYTLDADVKNENKVLQMFGKKGVTKVVQTNYDYEKKEHKNIQRPIVVGMGPAGLFAALVLAQMGYKPIVFERGKSVDERAVDVGLFWSKGILNTESNVQFGEGGAGTFSDGKLTTLINDPRSQKVLEEFVKAGAPEEIMYLNKPHIGTDILREVVKNIRKTIISLGGEVHFNSKVTDIIQEENSIVGVKINGDKVVNSDKVILALGHSSRDSFEMLYNKGVHIIQKGFSIGVRIEHPQSLINEKQYGENANHPKLPAAEYKLSAHFNNGRSAYTFCMCPGGMVVAATSEESMVVTNGMSLHARDAENANSALLVGVTPADYGSDHPLAGIQFQRKWEHLAFIQGGGDYKAPSQTVGDFLADKPSTTIASINPSYNPGIKAGDLRKCLPDYVSETLKLAILAFDKNIKGFANPDAVMTGVETRSSSPIRIPRDENFYSNIKGLYPVGEGAGYAGGIMSAAIDGIKVAESLYKK